jgi:serine/threonine protein kinase
MSWFCGDPKMPLYTRATPLPSGTVRGYTIVQARDGRSVICEAVDPSGRKVALKFTKHIHDDMGCVEKCSAREAELHSQLGHANVIPVLGDFKQGPFHCTALPWADGCLVDLLRAHRSGTTTDVARIVVAQLLDALRHVHARGIVHNDIKPENIIIQPGGGAMRIWLADFGCASRIEDVKTDMPVGTELCDRPNVERRWDEKADVFAVGLLAYRMVTRCNAFDQRHPLEKGVFRPHPKIDADTQFKNLLTGLLHITPQKRPSAGQALAHEAFWAARRQIAMECAKSPRETNSGGEGEGIPASRADVDDSHTRPAVNTFLSSTR